jgi:parvulin-like peptidyl-prolyl isomerase
VVKEGSVDSLLYDALNRTHPYQYTRVIKTKRGYHIAKVLDREYPRTLEMARGEIRGRLQSQYRQRKYEAFRDELFHKYQVRFPGQLPPFDLPRLSDRNHYRTLPGPIGGRGY